MINMTLGVREYDGIVYYLHSGVPIFSHSRDIVVATTLGAKVIEKHFILNKSIGGPDASFSLDEKEFTEMVSAVRQAEKAVGKITYELTEKVKASRKFGRSLFVVKDIKAGEKITEENVRSIRPGFGLHPKYLKEVLWKRVNRVVEKGERLSFEIVEIKKGIARISSRNDFTHYTEDMNIDY